MASFVVGGVECVPSSHTVVVGYDAHEEVEQAAQLFCELFRERFGRQFHVVKDLVWKRNSEFHPFGGDSQVRSPILIGNSDIMKEFLQQHSPEDTEQSLAKIIESEKPTAVVQFRTLGPFGMHIHSVYGKHPLAERTAVNYFFQNILDDSNSIDNLSVLLPLSEKDLLQQK